MGAVHVVGLPPLQAVVVGNALTVLEVLLEFRLAADHVARVGVRVAVGAVPAGDVVDAALVAGLEGADQLVGQRGIAPAAVFGRLGLHREVAVVVVLGEGPDVPAHLREQREGDLPDGLAALHIVLPVDHAMDGIELAAAVVDDVLELGFRLLEVADVHVGLGGIGEGAGLGEAADHPVCRPPVEILGGILEVVADGLPGLFVGLGTGLLRRGGVGLARHQHRHAAEVDGQVVVGGAAQAARLGLIDLAGRFRDHVVGDVLQVGQEEVGAGDHPVGILPRILEEGGLGFHAPGVLGHFRVPAVRLQVQGRQVGERRMRLDIVVGGGVQDAVHTGQAHEDIVGVFIHTVGVDDGVVFDIEEAVRAGDRRSGHAQGKQGI